MSTNLEELLARENPVQNLEDVRLSGDDVEARCAAILEGRRAMPATMPIREQPSTVRPLSNRLQPALAFAAGLILILAAIGSVALFARGGDVAPADEPTATTQALPSTTVAQEPTTVPPVSNRESTAPPYAEVPSFSGIVRYSQHDPALGEPGWQATVELVYAGPLQYEATVIEESGERLALMGPGTVFFGDGVDLWINESDDLGPWKLGFEPFRHLFFDADPSYPAWSEICAESQTVLGTDVVAGRTTTHMACSSTLEDYGLWVDEESGLVLKMIGPLEVGDLTPILDHDGVFEFTEIRFEPVTTPSAPIIPSHDQEFPPFHMVRTDTRGYEQSIRETWYLDDVTFRETESDASDPTTQVAFYLIADGQWNGCYAFENEQGCESVPLDPENDFLWTPAKEVPLDLMAENCTEVDSGTVVDRSARHFTCDGVGFAYMGYWQAAHDPAWGASEYWYDTELELMVKKVNHEFEWSWETTLLDVNPVFPEGIFEYLPMEFSEDEPQGIAAGDAAPNWSGPLVGGGDFDTADHRGEQPESSFVVLYDWFPGCGDVCTENLVEFQRLYETHGSRDSVTFVTVSEDTESETSRALERLNIDVPTVHCGWEPDAVCLPDSPWTLWLNGVPSDTVIDPDGQVVDVFTQPPIDDELRDLLALIAGEG
ncbi:MAG: redoxin domain-containing protein, partial [Acidimicrobiia bacterium]|nr:redoxin domain-containing protein [Acidimicrobiia bacterium]